MRRILVIAVSTMLVLTLALAAYGNNQTEVILDLNSSEYDIDIPSTVDVPINGTGTLNITLTKCHTDGVKVKIDGDSYNGRWNLLSEIGSFSIPYVIICDGKALGAEEEFFVSRLAGASLSIQADTSTMNKAPNGRYRDTLTFKIK